MTKREIDIIKRRTYHYRRETISYNSYCTEIAIIMSGIRGFIERVAVETGDCDKICPLPCDSENAMCGPLNVDSSISVLADAYARADLVHDYVVTKNPNIQKFEIYSDYLYSREREYADDEYTQLNHVRSLLDGSSPLIAMLGIKLCFDMYMKYDIYTIIYNYYVCKECKPYVIEEMWNNYLVAAQSVKCWRNAKRWYNARSSKYRK